MANFKVQNVAVLVKLTATKATTDRLQSPTAPLVEEKPIAGRKFQTAFLEIRLRRYYCLSIRNEEQDNVAISVVVVCR